MKDDLDALTFTDLAPCPFCGDRSQLYVTSNMAELDYVACECGAEGPPSEDEASAYSAWNTRATPDPAAVAGALPVSVLAGALLPHVEALRASYGEPSIKAATQAISGAGAAPHTPGAQHLAAIALMRALSGGNANAGG